MKPKIEPLTSHLDPEVIAELAVMPIEQLCERLVGTIRIPIQDGAGPLNGSNEFVRQFATGAIQHEAARRLQTLVRLVDLMNGLDIGYHLRERHDQGFLGDAGPFTYDELQSAMREAGIG